MHLYLYDSFLNDKRWATTLAKIETRLTDLGIGGKIYRLSPLRNLEQLLEEETRAGIKTVVVVGNDNTLTQAINQLARFAVTIGYIPIGEGIAIAHLLGIPTGEDACATLSARKVEPLDLGKINLSYFLAGITIAGTDVTFECDERYSVSTNGDCTIEVRNLPPDEPLQEIPGAGRLFSPHDGKLEILVRSNSRPAQGWRSWFKKNQPALPTVIPFERAIIRSKESVSIVTDGQRVHKTPVKVEVVPKKITLIVGKERSF